MIGRLMLAAGLALAVGWPVSAQEVTWPKTDFGRYHALVIGNNAYRYLPKLETAVNDAEAVAALLEERYGFKITKLINATRKDITGAFNHLRKTLTENDNLLVFYAGHGVLDEEADEGYWQPVDARPDDDSDWFPNDRLTRYLKAISAKHVMIIADSCYSGNLTRAGRSRLRSGMTGDAWVRRMSAKRSRTALTSGGLEPVLDRGGGDHSVFARALLTALKENQEVLVGAELFDRVKDVVVANAEQTSGYSDIRRTGHDKGDFLFVPVDLDVAATFKPPARPLPLAADREVLFWQTIKDSDNLADFEEYLKQFPGGTFAGLARNRTSDLKTPRTAQTLPRKPKFRVDPIEAEYVAVKNANVRKEPTVRSSKVSLLEQGTKVYVAGKVSGKNWYLIERTGKPLGYVFGELLRELVEPAAPEPRPRPERAEDRQEYESRPWAVAPAAGGPMAAVVPPSPEPARRTVRPVVGVYPIPPRAGETLPPDCRDCPEMVVIPAGGFTMGSPAGEDGREDGEGPRHSVSIPHAIALGRYEVTRAEFAAFVRDTGHDPRGCQVHDKKAWRQDDANGWRDPGFGQSELDPVVCVSWDDAHTYVRWLSGKAGREYRLPSESEWEYAARAGTTTSRYWGEDPDRACKYENVYDKAGRSENRFAWKRHDCRDDHAETAPVGGFRANRFGLRDILGNVGEWVADCWNDSYRDAPTDGSAWTAGDCNRRVIRGGSWSSASSSARAAARDNFAAGSRINTVGFRVARTLP